jgi:hypothetical protein
MNIEPGTGNREPPCLPLASLVALATLGLALAPVAQWLEQGTHNPLVAGSSPTGRTILYQCGIPQMGVKLHLFQFLLSWILPEPQKVESALLRIKRVAAQWCIARHC